MAYRVTYDDGSITTTVVPGESVQVWGGGSLVVVDSQNKQTAIFAGGYWNSAIREDDAEG